MSSSLVVMRDALRELGHKRVIVVIALVALGATLLFANLVSWQQRMFEASMDMAAQPEMARKMSLDTKQVEAMEAGRDQMAGFFQAEFFGIGSFCGVIVALIVFSTVVAGPLRQKELRAILARPLTRASYLMGRMAAGVVLLALFWLLMGLVFLLFFVRQGSSLPTIARLAPLLLFLKCLMLGTMALALSLFVRPLWAAMLTFFVSSDWVSSQGLLYLILPGDDRLSIGWQMLHGHVMEYQDVLLVSAYALLTVVAAAFIALVRFCRIEVS
jgi:ABC-type transport system involved in multi-copper enzyme maturation permease subunit